MTICYGCAHCGCDPDDPEDFCWVCDDCGYLDVDCTCGLPIGHVGVCR